MYYQFKQWKKSTILILLIFLFSFSLIGGNIQVSLPDTSGLKGQTLKIPITISDLSVEDSVLAGQFVLTYPSNVLSVTSVDVNGTLLSGKSCAFNPTTQSFAFSSTANISGNGVLVYLLVRINDNPNQMNGTLTFSSFKLNEGTPSVTFTGGKVKVKQILISPKTVVSNLFVGDSLQFSVSGDYVAPLTWTSKDVSIVTISTTGIMKGIAVGTTRIIVTDSQGLKDSTNLFPIQPISLKSLTVSIHDTSYTQTLSFLLPVYISDVTSLGVISAQLTINFNSQKLQVLDVVNSGSMTEQWSASHNVQSSSVSISLAGTEPLSGTGKLVYVKFKVMPNASGNSQISLSNVLFNESLNAGTVSGTFTPKTAPNVVISPNVANLVIGDTLRFKVTSGGTKPFLWTTSNTQLATINPDNGLLTAVSRGTVSVIVTDSLGFVGNSGNILISDLLISAPQIQLNYDDSIDFPIIIGDVTNLGISAFQTIISYDTTKIVFGGLVTASTLSENYSASVQDKNGMISIAAAGTENLVGFGDLIKLKFKPHPANSNGGSTNIIFQSFLLNEGQTVMAKTQNGKIAVNKPAVFPSKINLISPTNGESISTSSVDFIWWKGDQETIHYWLEYSITNDQFQTSTIDSSVADTTFFLKPLVNDATYWWRVRAKNQSGWGEFSSVGNFLVHYDPTGVTETNLEKSFYLSQNYPNPFNPITVISYQLLVVSHVNLVVFDLLGKEIKTLVSERKNAGVYQVNFDGANLPSGIYFYKIQTEKWSQTKKMVLMK